MQIIDALVLSYGKEAPDGKWTMSYYKMLHLMADFVWDNRDKFQEFMQLQGHKFDGVPEFVALEEEERKAALNENIINLKTVYSSPAKFQELPKEIQYREAIEQTLSAKHGNPVRHEELIKRVFAKIAPDIKSEEYLDEVLLTLIEEKKVEEYLDEVSRSFLWKDAVPKKAKQSGK